MFIVIGIEIMFDSDLIMVVLIFVNLFSGCMVIVFKLLNNRLIKKKLINKVMSVSGNGGSFVKIIILIISIVENISILNNVMLVIFFMF